MMRILKISKSNSSFMPSVSKQTLKLAVIFVQNQNNEDKASCIEKRKYDLLKFQRRFCYNKDIQMVSRN